MKCGLRVYDDSGNLIQDTLGGIACYLGTISTGFQDGTLQNAKLINQRIWMIPTAYAISADYYQRILMPTNPMSGRSLTLNVIDLPRIGFNYNTGTVSWSFDPVGTISTDTVSWKTIFNEKRISQDLIYGVF